MNYSSRDRLIRRIAEYIVAENATVRDAAKEFNISKSTVHFYVTDELRKFDTPLYKKVRAVLMKNKAERHMRGGLATKKMFEEKRKTT